MNECWVTGLSRVGVRIAWLAGSNQQAKQEASEQGLIQFARSLVYEKWTWAQLWKLAKNLTQSTACTHIEWFTLNLLVLIRFQLHIFCCPSCWWNGKLLFFGMPTFKLTWVNVNANEWHGGGGEGVVRFTAIHPSIVPFSTRLTRTFWAWAQCECCCRSMQFFPLPWTEPRTCLNNRLWWQWFRFHLFGSVCIYSHFPHMPLPPFTSKFKFEQRYSTFQHGFYAIFFFFFGLNNNFNILLGFA